MTTLTVNILNEKDLPLLQEILDRFGLTYIIDAEDEYPVTKAQIDDFLRTKQEFVAGKMSSRDWNDIEDDLSRAYN